MDYRLCFSQKKRETIKHTIMPHLIVEHSADIKKNSVQKLEQEIQDIMNGVEGNFDADQCKCRSISFDQYFVGRPDQSSSSFIHITLKVLTGRSVEVRTNLSAKISEFTNKFFTDLNIQNLQKYYLLRIAN